MCGILLSCLIAAAPGTEGVALAAPQEATAALGTVDPDDGIGWD